MIFLNNKLVMSCESNKLLVNSQLLGKILFICHVGQREKFESSKDSIFRLTDLMVQFSTTELQ